MAIQGFGDLLTCVFPDHQALLRPGSPVAQALAGLDKTIQSPWEDERRS